MLKLEINMRKLFCIGVFICITIGAFFAFVRFYPQQMVEASAISCIEVLTPDSAIYHNDFTSLYPIL